jgi:hypothetical protein
MSQQNVPSASRQINASVAAVQLIADPAGDPVPVDINKLILSNTSATGTLVTVTDGVVNYYYNVGAGATVIDTELEADRASTGWTVTCATSVNSLWVTAIFS